MPRAAANKTKLYDLTVRKLRPQAKTFLIWDDYQRGLAVRVQPSGKKSYVCVYRFNGRPRWYHIGYADAVCLKAARQEASNVQHKVLQGTDPQADKVAKRGQGTFAEMAARYVEEYAKRRNKSWQTTQKQVQRHLLPRWGSLKAEAITRPDVKAMMASLNDKPQLANNVKQAASAIFSWAMGEDLLKANPCAKVPDNLRQSRERVLADSEVPLFWTAFDNTTDPMQGVALKVLLLTGQRPGEVTSMRREHIVDGWWQLPGKPVPTLGWPGTKNGEDHRVWLPQAVQAVISDLDPEAKSGYVFAGPRGGAMGQLDATMREICASLSIANKVTPHDLRRTHGTTICSLRGFTRQDMNRIQNHKEGGVGSVYDRHDYAEQNKHVMESVASRLLALAGEGEDNVVQMKRA